MKRCRFISASAREGDELEDDAVSLGSHDSDDEEHGEDGGDEESPREGEERRGEAVDGGGRLGVQLLQQRARAVATRRQHALAQRGDHGEEQHNVVVGEFNVQHARPRAEEEARREAERDPARLVDGRPDLARRRQAAGPRVRLCPGNPFNFTST